MRRVWFKRVFRSTPHFLRARFIHTRWENISFEFFENAPRGNERSGQNATLHRDHERKA
jgi:hypothetical protein